jgi:branched-chain amino acid transport system permease protein
MEILILALFATSLNLILGYGGMTSFGHAGFYGLGLYLLAGLLKYTSLPFFIALLSASLGAALGGYVIGLMVVHLRGFYFSILTLAFGQLIWAIIWKWRDMTGGEDGIISVPIPEYVSQEINMYYFILIMVILGVGLVYWIINTPFGRALSAIRENSIRPVSIGINVERHRLIAFVISTFFSGLAGGLYCILVRAAFADQVSWGKSGEVLLSCVLGGMYVFLGPFVGSIIMIILESVVTAYFTERWPLILGILFIVVALVLPNGVLGTAKPIFAVRSKNSREN